MNNIKKRALSGLLSLALISSMVPMNLNKSYSEKLAGYEEKEIEERVSAAMGVVSVDTVQELKDEVLNQTGDKTITLSSTFPTTIVDPIIIQKNNTFELVIDGEGKTLTASLPINKSIFEITDIEGKMTIQNIKFDMNKNLLNKAVFTLNKGLRIVAELNLLNLEVYDSIGGGFFFGNQTTKCNLENIKMYNNENFASIEIPSDYASEINIKNSTIEDNVTSGYGVERGALSAKHFRGTLNIDNTVFKNNINNSEASAASVGGGGGAIAIHYLYGNVNITDSYFAENQTSGAQAPDVKQTYDGGAIYIFDGRDGAKVNIDRTTFNKNKAFDDGGAIMFQGTGTPAGLETNVRNCTFYDNQADGLDGVGRSGGAIQYFKNGGSSVMRNTILSSTFVKNQAGSEKTSVVQQGGAIALSGAGTFATATVTYNDSLFIGNSVYTSDGTLNTLSNYKDISNSGTAQEGTRNVINLDKGTSPTHTIEDVLGKNNAMLVENQSSTKAGATGKELIIPTIPIKPEGVADNTYSGTAALLTEEQRNFKRHKDQGAIEMTWIKYNANGGVFNIAELTEYNGTEYSELNTEGKITDYFSIGGNGQGIDILSGGYLKATKPGEVFKGWSTTPDGEVDPNYPVGGEVVLVDENMELYAVWGEPPVEIKYTIEYDGNTNTGGKAAVDSGSPYLENSEVTILDKETLVKEGHVFMGWNTEPNGGGASYRVGDKLTIVGNIKLYAQWKRVGTEHKYIIRYDGNGHTSGDEVVDAKSPYERDTEVTVLGHDTLAKEGYKFIGWNTKADGSGTVYKTGGTFNIIEDMVLYAQWEKDGGPVDPPVDPPLPPIDPEVEINKKDHFGYMIGFQDRTFRPNANITRAEAGTIFFRVLTDESREKLRSNTNSFSDVAKTEWYNNAISTVSNGNIMNGYPDGTFDPYGDMTRAELITLMARFFKVEEYEGYNYPDIEGHWAEKEIQILISKGWLVGYPDGTIKPDNPITRAEAVKLLNVMLERTPDKERFLEGMLEFRDNKDSTQWYYTDVQELINSHEYTRETVDSVETWTNLLPIRDWEALEKEWSISDSE